MQQTRAMDLALSHSVISRLLNSTCERAMVMQMSFIIYKYSTIVCSNIVINVHKQLPILVGNRQPPSIAVVRVTGYINIR